MCAFKATPMGRYPQALLIWSADGVVAAKPPGVYGQSRSPERLRAAVPAIAGASSAFAARI